MNISLRKLKRSTKVFLRSVNITVLLMLTVFYSFGGFDLYLGLTTPFAPKRADAAYTGKRLRTVEFALGGGGGTGAAQTGTDNNGVARNSDDNLYAGSAWNTTKATAGTKTVQIPGSGIRVVSAYLDIATTIVTAADVTDLELSMDVSPGPAPGSDIAIGQVARNGVGLIYNDNSGDSPLLTAKGNVTALFQTQTDSDWNSGVAVVGMLSVVGPTWHLATMKLTITYEEDYSLISHDELKTVRYPLRSTTAGDSGTKRSDCAIGATCSFTYSLDLPDLRTTADIVDVWFEISYVGAGTDSMTPSIAGGTAGNPYNSLEALTDRAERFIIFSPAIGGADLGTSTQTLNIVDGVAAVGGLGGEVVVTYKYSTGAATQVETVQYWMGQQEALPGTASSSFAQQVTIANGSRDPRAIWFRVHDAITNAPTINIGGKIGASATNTIQYTTTSANARAGEMRIIHDMGAATTSWSGSATALQVDVRHIANTYDASPGVEAFITFRWAGGLYGPVTQTGKFFAGTSGAVPALANSDNTFPFTVTLPETVTKTLRSSYLATSVNHSDATSIVPGTVMISLSGRAPVFITEGTEDIESFRAIYLTQATSTTMYPGAVIDWTSRRFQTIVRGDQTEEYAVSAEMIVTYDADLELKVPMFTQYYYRLYVDNNALKPTDAWPAGAIDLGENTEITLQDLPPGNGSRVRIRMSATVATTTMTASSTQFKLQYAPRVTTCAAIGSWNDLGAPGSGSVWRGFNGTPADGTNLSLNPPTGGDLLLSVSDRAGLYLESNANIQNPFSTAVGEEVEYDWNVQNNNAATDTPYCFRMTKSDGTAFWSYTYYPTIMTAGYTAETRDWRWYDDETNETPVTPLAASNTAPSNVQNTNILKLRMTINETNGSNGVAQKFKIQYSEWSDFSRGVFDVTATSSCTVNSLWCYGDGVDNDDDAISTILLVGDATAKGRHNEAPTTTSTMGPLASTKTEFEFTLKHAGARANTTYFFRAYDVNHSRPVPAASGEPYPSLSTEGATLSFAISGVSSTTVAEGITPDVDTSATAVPFGTVPIGVAGKKAAQRLTVSTNATEGYQVFLRSNDLLRNMSYATTVPDVSGTNAAPTTWAIGCVTGVSGCWGYHAGDDTLSGGSTRFLSNDTYAKYSTTTPEEVIYNSGPINNEATDMIYRIEAHQSQVGGQYSTNLEYIVVPIF